MSKRSEQPVVIPPGKTIGILGSGQHGRMMAIAAKQMGYRVHILSPAHDSPAGQVADLEIQASYGDLEAFEAFAKHIDVVTVETADIPLRTLEIASKFVPVFPGRRALKICQNRLWAKQFLQKSGIPTCEFLPIRTLEELKIACRDMMPCVLKTATGGYDGTGQYVIQSDSEIEEAWKTLGSRDTVLERYMQSDFEFSIIGVRNSAGLMTAYPSIRNEYRYGMLDLSVSPSGLVKQLEEEATDIAIEIMSGLESTGVLTVEFFYSDGAIYVKEIAPRPHYSGHLTIEGHRSSQFEQHIRAICGLASSSTSQLQPVAMANVFGSEWASGSPQWHLALSVPDTHMHLYGKGLPERGRKMGHLTSAGATVKQARENALAARRLLRADIAHDSISSFSGVQSGAAVRKRI